MLGRPGLAAVLTVALLGSACAPKNYVVLLENPEGGAGEVTVSNSAGEQALDTAQSATTVNKADRAPSKPWTVALEKLEEVFGAAFSMRPPSASHYTIYFESGSTEISAASADTVAAMMEDASNRPSPDADVFGHADRVAQEQKNEILALVRAYTVRDLLVDAGVSAGRIRVDSYGESNPAIETPDEVPEPGNRRVEVTLR